MQHLNVCFHFVPVMPSGVVIFHMFCVRCQVKLIVYSSLPQGLC